MKRKLTLVFSAILLIIISGLGYYYGYYVKTPNHTLQIIVKAVQNKDVKTFNKHVDVKSVVGYWIDDVISKEPGFNNNTMAAAFIPVFKSIAEEAIQEQVNNEIAKPDEDNNQLPQVDNKNLNTLSKGLSKLKNNHKDLQITNMHSNKIKDDVQVVLTIKNTKTLATADYSIYMHPLTDGTWQIYKADPLKILIDLDK